MQTPSAYIARGTLHAASNVLIVVLFLALFVQPLGAQNVGDTVRLESANPKGVPVHPAAGDRSFVRWENGTIGTVKAIDLQTGWFHLESPGKSGWVVKKYLTIIVDEDEPGITPEPLSYVVGTWNLEHFRDGASRGFPENTRGGPTYGPRTSEDFQEIARVISSQLSAKILILNEINGRSGTKESVELNRLLTFLGGNWDYELTESGRRIRIAILYDTNAVHKERCVEFVVPEQIADGKDVFDRDPLACLFTFLDASGQSMNDLIVVGLHLASGQRHVENHNTAMAILRTRISRALTDGTFPAGERDILIGGDLNASRYDTRVENFWVGYQINGTEFATLSPTNGPDYPGTRLAGVPLFPRSQIDYLIASMKLSEDLVQPLAQVNLELLLAGFDEFREHLSDHIPVTVTVPVSLDDD